MEQADAAVVALAHRETQESVSCSGVVARRSTDLEVWKCVRGTHPGVRGVPRPHWISVDIGL